MKVRSRENAGREAVATGGSTFEGWSGAGCSGTGVCLVTMDAAKSVTAESDLVQAIVQFEALTHTVSERRRVARVAVIRAGDCKTSLTVSFSTGGGRATPRPDHRPTRGALRFRPGEVRKSFGIPIVNDARREPDETASRSRIRPGVPSWGSEPRPS